MTKPVSMSTDATGVRIYISRALNSDRHTARIMKTSPHDTPGVVQSDDRACRFFAKTSVERRRKETNSNDVTNRKLLILL